ncbi:MAG: DUF1957 domain-containing protein, partial [Verrucomicrobiae bacterium]|nr:DUF1957 domain-containing protein [Verrucomicrobiae bacterium]
SRQCGYPGDPRYRDFYRDIGYDLDFEYVRPYLPAPTVRGYTGIKYYAVTGKVSPKRFYVPDAALQAVDEHVSDFLRARLQQLSAARHYMKCAPILVMPFDAELFGHWWFEGPIFLDHFVRKAMQYRDSLLISTPTAYLERTDVPCTMTLGLSSWGKGGYLETWLNERTSWIYPPLYAAARKMGRLAAAYKVTNELGARIITQAARELLIAQSSDWAFMISTDTNQAYAIRKIVGHLRNHSALCAQFESKSQDPALLEQLERESGIINPFNPQYFVN